MPSAAKLAKLISTNPGLITTKEPTNPIITADHLLKPTFSFRNIGEKVWLRLAQVLCMDFI